MYLFSQEGVWGISRVAHVLFAIVWMGLLYYFNFVQTPAFAEMEPGARNNAFDKLAWRALWWFRWAAAFTVLTGILIIGAGMGDLDVYSEAYWTSPSGLGLIVSIAFALTMLTNVWMFIWPNQRIVIANARTVQGGGEADPAAPAAARAAAMASRQNVIFSLPVIWFMVSSSHVYNSGQFDLNPGSGSVTAFLLIGLVVLVLLEANALGVFGRPPGGTRVIYDTHQNAIIAGFVLVVLFYLLTEIIFSA